MKKKNNNKITHSETQFQKSYYFNPHVFRSDQSCINELRDLIFNFVNNKELTNQWIPSCHDTV
jgi:hypothetical protein